MKKNISVFTLLCLVIIVHSQVTTKDYRRADSTVQFREMVYGNILSSAWIDSTHHFWYLCQTKEGREYKIVDAVSKTNKPFFDQVCFCNSLNKLLGSTYTPFNLPITDFKPSRDLKSFEFMLDNKYAYNIKDNTIKITGNLPAEEPYWGNSFDELSNKPVISPDSNFEAGIRNYNIYIKKRKTSDETQLSFDGSEGEFYSSYIIWSPDSKNIVTYKIRDNKKKFLFLLESTPKDQFLPKTYQKEYLRPGDALPVRLPVLFNVNDKKQIELNTSFYTNQYAVENLSWDTLGSSFTFEFNQRGHQLYQVVRVNALSGEMTTIINEQSKTFIDYSGKKYRYNLKNEKGIIWASERDGWNHLYLFNSQTGVLINQITIGKWMVRSVEKVDEKSRKIIFSASGYNSDEDPYYIHYYSINFDGTGLVDLTPEKANHDALFSKDGTLFCDTYSTVRIPPVSVLRETLTGKCLLTIEKADISELLVRGFVYPEAFVAKGRDGKTDIWGNIYRPANFDSTKIYPIIEFIYAGPQSSYVPKSFIPYFSPVAGLTELGFIAVMIDGMGTSNRSKAFHDVCYKNLKDASFEDRILWMKAAAKKYKYMETTRVGVFGGSAGGQNAAAALLFHPEFYKVGVASCGCHDNRMDKMWWNEQWLGYPIGPQYSECSNIENASKLQGHLMLILGEMDDNVDPSSTYRLADALIKEKKDFEMVLLPGVNHTLGGDYGEHKRRDFFVRYLLGTEPPAWNERNN